MLEASILRLSEKKNHDFYFKKCLFMTYFCFSWALKTFITVQLLTRVWLFETPWTAACQAFLSITNYWGLLKLMSIESVMPSYCLILCCSLLLLPLIFLSIKVFSTKSVLHIRWPKCWNFSFSISLSSEYSGLISFRINWFDLLAAQGTLKESSPKPLFKSISSSVSSFFIVQLSHSYRLLEKL